MRCVYRGKPGPLRVAFLTDPDRWRNYSGRAKLLLSRFNHSTSPMNTASGLTGFHLHGTSDLRVTGANREIRCSIGDDV
jgi:hypothetical protein